MRSVPGLALLFFLAAISAGQDKPAASSNAFAGSVFSSREMGFSFTPPLAFQNLTARVQEAEAKQASDGRMRFSTLLFLSSGPDDTSSEWVSLGIETFPRGRDKDKSDDLSASVITNYAAIGGTALDRQSAHFGGQTFAVLIVKHTDTRPNRFAIAYTTVRKEKFLTFVFAGNTREKVEHLAGVMQTLRFAP